MTVGAVRGERPLIVHGFDAECRQRILLPLVTQRQWGVTLGSFPSGKHANFNFPLTCPETMFSRTAIDLLLAQVARARAIDLFIFDALPSQWNGTANPLLCLPHRFHPAMASVLDLCTPPFEVPSNLSGRKRRQARHADRALARVGVCLRRATDAVDIAHSLQLFLTQKSRWFSRRGIANSFSDAGVAEFLLTLFSRSESGAELHLLRVGDADIAVAGVLTKDRHASLMFTSYDVTSPYVGQGPGKHLLRLLSDELRRRSFQTFDFGLGEAPHKYEIGAASQNVYSVSRAFAPGGAVLAFVKEAERKTKRYVKQSPHLFAASRTVQVRLRAMTK